MKIFSKKKESKYGSLISEIEKIKISLDSAYSNFENVSDPDLIDSYIYEVNAIQKRYKFLLRQAKEIEKKDLKVERGIDIWKMIFLKSNKTSKTL